jgi:hypothetical protein
MAALFAIFAMMITVLVFLGIALLPAACIYVGWNYGVLAAFPDASLGALTFSPASPPACDSLFLPTPSSMSPGTSGSRLAWRPQRELTPS